MLELKEFEENCWREVYNRIIGAVVFIDNPAAECLHWMGGMSLILSAGAVAVRSLTPFEYAQDCHKKAVFITQLTSNNINALRDIIKSSKFSQCVVISTMSLDVIYDEQRNTNMPMGSTQNADVEGENMLKQNIVGWMSCEQYLVEVIHVPIFTISLTNNIFLMPPHSNIFPLFNGKLIQVPKDNENITLSNTESIDIRRLSSDLNSMLDALQLKEDVYFMGSYSSMIADILGNNPLYVARKKRCNKLASLILIDRTLDLGSVTSHNMETVFGKIMTVLPKLPGHSTDVAVDMSPLCRTNVVNFKDDIQLSPGCLNHPNDDFCREMVDQFINEPYKDALLRLYHRLSRIDVSRSPVPAKLLKVTPQSIDKIIAVCKENYDLIEKHSGVLQQSLAVHQMLTSPSLPQIELLTNLEKQVLENIATCGDSTSVLLLVCSLIEERKSKNVDLMSLLTLLIYIYSLPGHDMKFNQEHEEHLQDLLGRAVMQDISQLDTMFPDYYVVDISICNCIAHNMMKTLRDVSKMRAKLDKYKSVIKKTETGVEYIGVLQQLWADMVTSRSPMRDLNLRTDGFRDLVQTGLKLFGKSRMSRHPLDSPCIIVCVVGGVTADECRRLRADILAAGHHNVLVGSTSMPTPHQVAHQVFSQCNE